MSSFGSSIPPTPSGPAAGEASPTVSGFPEARGRGARARAGPATAGADPRPGRPRVRLRPLPAGARTLGCGTWGRGRSGARPGASFGAIDVPVEALQEGGERGHPLRGGLTLALGPASWLLIATASYDAGSCSHHLTPCPTAPGARSRHRDDANRTGLVGVKAGIRPGCSPGSNPDRARHGRRPIRRKKSPASGPVRKTV